MTDEVQHPSNFEQRLSVIEQKLDLVLSGLATISRSLRTMSQKENAVMATLDQVIADIADENTQIGGLSVLTASLKQQLTDALAGTVIPPTVQAKIDGIFAGIEANKAKVVDAINANTPVVVPPVVPPPAQATHKP